MREVFDYTRRNVEDQPEGLEYVRAQDLYRQLRKRQESEGDDKIDIDAESLVLMDGAFRENPEFADEHTWTKEQLIEKVQKSHGVSSLEVIGFIGEEDPEKAKELLQGISDNINQEYKRLKRSKDGVRDYDGEREAYAFITQLETVANSIGGQEYVSEIYDMAGYEHPLEVTLHDREYKRHEIKILHLRAPELDVANADVAVENMAKYQEYFKQVIEPAEFLSGWNGVGDRYKFLADETNKALEGAVTVINNHPESAMELRKLTETAITLNKLLHHEVVVPFSNIENVNTFSEVVSNEEVETNRPEYMEYELLNACIEARDSELVNQQLSNVFKVLDSIDQDLIDNPPISEWKGREQRGYYSPMWKERVTIEAYDELYEKIKVLGDSNPEFENIAKRAKERYETTLRSLVPDAHNKTVDIVERRLEEITEPSENWGETLELLHAFNNSNKVRTSSQYELKPDTVNEDFVSGRADLISEFETDFSVISNFLHLD